MPRPKAEKPQYKKRIFREITITINADEETLDRLATMLLFARVPVKMEKYEDPPLPWPLGEEGKPDDAILFGPPEEEIRVEIAKRLRFYIDRVGLEMAKNFLKEFEVEKVTDLQGAKLRQFHALLVKCTPKYREEV